jgi:predicted nucleic acid-binding protein
MKFFLDTNVLVAACLADHEHHARAIPVVQMVHDGKAQGFVSGHSLLEAYSILTRLPRVPRIPPMQAATLISDNFVNYFAVTTLAAREYSDLCQKLGREGIIGGRSYDLLHLACAEKSQAERIFTFNVNHFSELAPHLRNRIAAP